MATQEPKDGTTQSNASERKIVGSVIQSGRIYKAGDEDALHAALPETDRHRLTASGQLTGDWSGDAPAPKAEGSKGSEGAESETDETDSEEEEGLPPLSGMADHLAGITTVDDVKALRKTDKRKGAKPLYEARIKEIEAGEEG